MTIPYSMTLLDNTIVSTVGQEVANAVRRESQLFDIVVKRPMPSARGVQWQALLEGNTASNFVVGADLSAAGAVTNVEASLTSGNIESSIKFAHKQLMEIDYGTKLGQMKLNGLIDVAVNDMARSVASKIHTEMLTGSGSASQQLLGLDSWIASTGTVAGISRTTYPAWACYDNVAGSARALSLAVIDDAVQVFRNTKSTVSSFSSGNWAILTNGANANIIRGFASSQDTSRAPIGDQAVKIFGYAQSFYRGNIPVIEVAGMAAGAIYFVDMSKLELLYLPGPNGEMFIPGEEQTVGQNTTLPMFAYFIQRILNPKLNAFVISDLSS